MQCICYKSHGIVAGRPLRFPPHIGSMSCLNERCEVAAISPVGCLCNIKYILQSLVFSTNFVCTMQVSFTPRVVFGRIRALVSWKEGENMFFFWGGGNRYCISRIFAVLPMNHLVGLYKGI